MNSYEEIILDYESGECSLKEAAFLLVNMIIKKGVNNLQDLPALLEEEIINIALLHVVEDKLEFHTSEGFVDQSVNGKKLVDEVNEYLEIRRKKSLQEIAVERYPDRI